MTKNVISLFFILFSRFLFFWNKVSTYNFIFYNCFIILYSTRPSAGRHEQVNGHDITYPVLDARRQPMWSLLAVIHVPSLSCSFADPTWLRRYINLVLPSPLLNVDLDITLRPCAFPLDRQSDRSALGRRTALVLSDEINSAPTPERTNVWSLQ